MILRRSKSPSKAAPALSGAWPQPSSSLSSSRHPSPTRPSSRAHTQSTHSTDRVYNSGAEVDAHSHHRASSEAVTKADFWDVVVENEDEASLLLPWLGNVVTEHSSGTEDFDEQRYSDCQTGDQVPRSSSSGSISAVPSRNDRHTPLHSSTSASAGATGNPKRFDSMLMELVETERSYVRRLDVLYNRYAQPLRQLARHRDSAIIPLYEAQRLFGNVGELLGANTAFLREMDLLLQQGGGRLDALKANIGSLAHNHMACFSCYNEYFNNFEKAKHIEQTMSRSNRAFRDFADEIKHTSSNLGNVSIRELIMEPIQRIPRYKLFLDGLVKCLPAEYSGQRAKLDGAIVLCSKIANFEVDEKTQRAAVLWSFGRNVQGFPAGLFSVHRRFIDAIDVEDFPVEFGNPAAPLDPGIFSPVASSSRTISCTLFLFDDSLLVAKRNSAHTSGRHVLGLNNLNRLADEMKTFTEKSGASSVPSTRKGELSFRGVSEIADVLASDLSGPDMQLLLKKSPAHIHHEKWNARPLRQYSVLADARADSPPRFEKMRFLENLWRAQALHKTRNSRNHVRASVIPATLLSGKESPRGEDAEPRRLVHWNVYERSHYLKETLRSPVVLHFDPFRRSQPLPFGPAEGDHPQAQMCIHSIFEAYGECSYSIRRRVDIQEEEEYVLPLNEIAKRMRKLHDSLVLADDQALLAHFRGGDAAGGYSSHRGRVAAGLENFGRSLFSGTPESLRFGSPRRKGSILSKSSVATSLASDLFSNSGRSVSTAGTSINSRDMLSMAHNTASVDGSGKLLPPGGSQISRAAGNRQHHRTISAGTVDLVMNQSQAVTYEQLPQRKRPMSSLSPNTAIQAVPRISFDGASERRTRAHSVGPVGDESASQADSSAVWQRAFARPSGPRAAPTPSSPQRKAVPTYPDLVSVPHTPTRRMPSTSKRSAPSDESEDENNAHPGAQAQTAGESSGQKANKRPTYEAGRAGNIRRDKDDEGDVTVAPLTPAKDRSKPLQPSMKQCLTSASVAPASARFGASGLRGCVRRHIVRLDEIDKENLNSLTNLADEVSELQGAASHLHSPLLRDFVARMETWIADASDRSADCKSSIGRIAGDVEALLCRLDESEIERETLSRPPAEMSRAKVQRLEDLEKQVRETSVFKTRCEALQRKCELLTALERDGRLENGELHKAFNEELDRMYDDASLSNRDKEVAALRQEIKRTKAQRNDLQRRQWEMEKDLKIQRSQVDSYEKILREHGLI